MTVLFADVKGSMELSGAVDAEQWWGVMGRFFELLCDGVHRFGGRVDRFTGDGIMAVFGAPLAYEDHARRACHSALYLRDALPRYAAGLLQQPGLEFSVRIGVNSGQVVVGTIGDDLSVEYTAIGHTAGLAQRMEALAEPGKVYLTEHTARLVDGFFDLQDLGAFEVKGVRAPIGVFELAGAGLLCTPLEVSRARGLSRFVGRQVESVLLEETLAEVNAGNGAVVGVVGDPGVGKSRLCYEFVERCRRAGVDVSQAHALSHASTAPFLPVLQLLRNYFGINERDGDRAARQKVMQLSHASNGVAAVDLGLVLDFMGLADPQHPLPRVDPEARQRQLFAAFNQMVGAQAARGPAVILIEDLHWLDPGSESFLENLVSGLRGTRTLLLVTFRPQFAADWMGKPYYRQVRLETLDQEAAASLMTDLLGSHPSLEGVAAMVTERADGNPFFMEEIINSLSESGTLEGGRGAHRLMHAIGAIHIPPNIESVLAARIDRLAAQEKTVLQTAAVLGRQFDEALLQGVSGISAGEQAAALSELVVSDFIRETAPQSYRFKHALIEDVAYRSQLSANRTRIHGSAAATLIELNPEKLDEHAALIAHHFEAAGERLAAAQWSARAAGWAGYNDPSEALRHWRKVRDLTDALEPSAEQTMLGLGARMLLLNFAWRLGVPEGQTQDDFERDTARTFGEGEALALRSGDVGQQGVLLAIYATLRGLSGHIEEQVRLGREAIRLTDQAGNLGLQVVVRLNAFYGLMALGRYPEAIAATEEGIALTGGDPTVGGGVSMASPYAFLSMWRTILRAHTGHLADVQPELEHALKVARDVGDVETEGWVLQNHAQIADLGGVNEEAALQSALQGLALAERTGSGFARGYAYCYVGGAHVVHRNWAEAIVALEQALAIWRERRVGLELEPHALSYLARAQLGRGDPTAARATAENAIALALRRGTKGWELQARIALAQAMRASDRRPVNGAVERELDLALALVEETGARSLEPRIRLELAGLAHERGDDATAELQINRATQRLVEIGAPVLPTRAQLR